MTDGGREKQERRRLEDERSALAGLQEVIEELRRHSRREARRRRLAHGQGLLESPPVEQPVHVVFDRAHFALHNLVRRQLWKGERVSRLSDGGGGAGSAFARE